MFGSILPHSDAACAFDSSSLDRHVGELRIGVLRLQIGIGQLLRFDHAVPVLRIGRSERSRDWCRASARRLRGCSASRARRSPGPAAAARRRRSRDSWSKSARSTRTGTPRDRPCVITPPLACTLATIASAIVAAVERVAALRLDQAQRLRQRRIADDAVERRRLAVDEERRLRIGIVAQAVGRALRRSVVAAFGEAPAFVGESRRALERLLEADRAESLEQRVVAGDRARHGGRVDAAARARSSRRASS